MTAAIFGLLGVIIGGLLNAGIAWIGDRRRSRRDARVAIRLVATEIEENQISFKLALEARSYRQFEYAGTKAWDSWRETLADVLTDEDWEPINKYFVRAENLIGLAGEMDYADFAKEDDETERELLETVRDEGERALEAIKGRAANCS
jgi:hypothetical protein